MAGTLAATVALMVGVSAVGVPDKADLGTHLRALSLSETQERLAEAAFERYRAGLEEIGDAEGVLGQWLGRWTLEHRYWRNLAEWQRQIVPPEWSAERAVEEAREAVWDQYIGELKRIAPGRVEQVDLMAGAYARSDALFAAVRLGYRHPDPFWTLVDAAPRSLLDDPIVEALREYESASGPLLEQRTVDGAVLKRRYSRLVEQRDLDGLTTFFARTPVTDCSLRELTKQTIRAVTDLIGDSQDAARFRELAESRLYPELPKCEEAGNAIQGALRSRTDLPEQATDRLERLLAEVEEDRARASRAFDALFVRSRIEEIARQQAKAILDPSSGEFVSFDEPYREIEAEIDLDCERIMEQVRDVLRQSSKETSR